MSLCLVAVLGVGILCSGADKPRQPVAVSDFCEVAGPDSEIAALNRPRKEAIVTLKKQHKKLCPSSR
jgi:hypothetical protein